MHSINSEKGKKDNYDILVFCGIISLNFLQKILQPPNFPHQLNSTGQNILNISSYFAIQFGTKTYFNLFQMSSDQMQQNFLLV